MSSKNTSTSNVEDVPIWYKYSLNIKEAAQYFNIGERKLRRLAEENEDSSWLLHNGEHIRIKRRLFEELLDKVSSI